MTKITWNTYNEAELIRLWGEKKTGSQIAEILNLSRCSIMGKLHRLGLLGKGNTLVKPVVLNPVTRIVADPKEKRVGITLERTNSTTCMYPTTNGKPFLYCGRTVKEGVYCQKHADLCYGATSEADKYIKGLAYWVK
jgi:hypothetical protein